MAQLLSSLFIPNAVCSSQCRPYVGLKCTQAGKVKPSPPIREKNFHFFLLFSKDSLIPYSVHSIVSPVPFINCVSCSRVDRCSFYSLIGRAYHRVRYIRREFFKPMRTCREHKKIMLLFGCCCCGRHGVMNGPHHIKPHHIALSRNERRSIFPFLCVFGWNEVVEWIWLEDEAIYNEL